jgi:hypothetical protein
LFLRREGRQFYRLMTMRPGQRGRQNATVPSPPKMHLTLCCAPTWRPNPAWTPRWSVASGWAPRVPSGPVRSERGGAGDLGPGRLRWERGFSRGDSPAGPPAGWRAGFCALRTTRAGAVAAACKQQQASNCFSVSVAAAAVAPQTVRYRLDESLVRG